MQALLPGTGNDGGWGELDSAARMNAAVWTLGLGDLLPPPEGSFVFGVTHWPVPGFSAGSTPKAKYPGAPIEGRASLYPVPQPTHCFR